MLQRHSVRQYLDKPIEKAKIEQLQYCIDECNRQGGTNLQIVTDEPLAFSGAIAKYSRFSGVKNYIAVVGRQVDNVALGYYGEQVVLLAQTIGLNTCWVGVSYTKQPDKYEVRDGEKLACMISLGYGANQGSAHPQKKGIENYCTDKRSESAPLPDWFIKGMEAALLAPTAVNQQRFEFQLHDNNIVTAKTRFSLMRTYTLIDLGIAKCHFEIGANSDNFSWG